MTTDRTIILDGREVAYELTRKRVKNINLRIRPDSSVHVSAGNRVALRTIEDFLRSKSRFILLAVDRYAERARLAPARREYDNHECQTVLGGIVAATWPVFHKYGIAMPRITYRDMSSRWGSCQPTRGRITLNKRLLAAPREAIEYVVMHEFVHFLHPNHSPRFYETLAALMPDWKARKRLLEMP